MHRVCHLLNRGRRLARGRRRPRVGGVPALAATTLLMLAAPAAAQTTQPVPDDPVAALADPRWEVRDAATRQLLLAPTFDEPALLDLARQAHHPESAARLLKVAEHHTIRRWREALPPEASPQARRGSLGVAHAVAQAGEVPGLDRPGIWITAVVPGWPGAQQLNTGDVITAVRGVPVDAGTPADAFARTVQGVGADQVLDLDIFRAGQGQQVRVTLAAADAVERLWVQPGQQLRDPYATQWRQLRRRLIEAMPETAQMHHLIGPPPGPADGL